MTAQLALHSRRNLDYGSLGELLARAMYDNFNGFTVPNLAGPARLAPLAAVVSEEFSLSALRQSAQRGWLEAYQGTGGSWRSSEKGRRRLPRTKGGHRR